MFVRCLKKGLFIFLLSFLLIFVNDVVAKTSLSILNNPFQYADEYTDQENHLQYLNARYYYPNIQRFITRDSVQLMNRYAYASGNPIMFADPSGHNAKKADKVLENIWKYGSWSAGTLLSTLFAINNIYTYSQKRWLLNAVGISFPTVGLISSILGMMYMQTQKTAYQDAAFYSAFAVTPLFISFSVLGTDPHLKKQAVAATDGLKEARQVDETSSVAEPLSAMAIIFNGAALMVGITGLLEHDKNNQHFGNLRTVLGFMAGVVSLWPSRGNFGEMAEKLTVKAATKIAGASYLSI